MHACSALSADMVALQFCLVPPETIVEAGARKNVIKMVAEHELVLCWDFNWNNCSSNSDILNYHFERYLVCGIACGGC